MQRLQAAPVAIDRIYSHDARQWLDISGLRPPQQSLFPYQPQNGMLQPFTAPMVQYQQLQYQQYVPQLQMQQLHLQPQPQPPPLSQQHHYQQQHQHPHQQQQHHHHHHHHHHQQQQQQQQKILSGTKRNDLGELNPHEEQPPAPKKPRLSPISPSTTTTTVTPAKRGPGRPTNASKGLPTKRAPRKPKSKAPSPTTPTTITTTGQTQTQPPPAPQPVPFYLGFCPPAAGLVLAQVPMPVPVPMPVGMTAALEREVDAGVRAQMAALEEEVEGGLFDEFLGGRGGQGMEAAPVEVQKEEEGDALAEARWDALWAQDDEAAVVPSGEEEEDRLARPIVAGLAAARGQGGEEVQAAEVAPVPSVEVPVKEDEDDEDDSLAKAILTGLAAAEDQEGEEAQVAQVAPEVLEDEGDSLFGDDPAEGEPGAGADDDDDDDNDSWFGDTTDLFE